MVTDIPSGAIDFGLQIASCDCNITTSVNNYRCLCGKDLWIESKFHHLSPPATSPATAQISPAIISILTLSSYDWSDSANIWKPPELLPLNLLKTENLRLSVPRPKLGPSLVLITHVTRITHITQNTKSLTHQLSITTTTHHNAWNLCKSWGTDKPSYSCNQYMWKSLPE